MSAEPPRFALLACRVFEDEIAAHMPPGARVGPVRYFEVGLHDHPENLRRELQDAILAFDSDDTIGAVVLAYALCGRGTAGLRAGRHPLVIPRAHDCMTVFMGSKEAYAAHQSQTPDAYYFTPGWMREKRTPGPARLDSLRKEFSEKFDPDDVEFLIQSERDVWARHGRAVYMDLGTPGSEACEACARADAAWLGWQFERLPGDPSLLRDLLAGNWNDARFQVVPPGGRLAHSPDAMIFRADPPQAQ